MIRKYFIFICLVLLYSCGTKQVKTPSIIELVDTDYRFSTSILMNFCQENNVNPSLVYQWQNHWVIYNVSGNAKELSDKLETQFPRLTIKLYDKPVYNFNRQKFTNEAPAKEWKNVIMTANLVNDTVKQKEYMEYHRTQFKKWPEVSKGFCNADFQQVLVFRTGRQLMLVISIPKGKTLDELNPKTTENNPRVNEWNKMMSRYQEGIEDAPKGTTWVTFKPIEN